MGKTDTTDTAGAVRRSVALHEAGHAVVALRLGYRVQAVRLTGPARGEVELAPRVLPDTAPVQEGRVMLKLAGVCAQATLAETPRGLLEGAAGDLGGATALAVSLVGRQKALPLVHLLLRQTEALLRREQAAVRRVQEALLARGALTGDEVRALVDAGRR
jgi:hypothetical protein